MQEVFSIKHLFRQVSYPVRMNHSSYIFFRKRKKGKSGICQICWFTDISECLFCFQTIFRIGIP